ncbi:MAG: site-specific recombinase [Actinomycetota bacterium]|nr:site-specific recombinase [Actinomycetota bacterium]
MRGNLWQTRRVAEVLKKPRVAGLLTYHGTVIGRYADYEPIVPDEEHETLRARFDNCKSGRPPTKAYLLSGGLLVCGRCGNNLSGRPYKQRLRADGTPRQVYRCVIRDIGSDQCGCLDIDLLKVETEVRAMVIATLADPAHSRQVARTSAKLAAAQTKLDSAKNDAVELAKRLGEGRLSLTAYDAACEPLNKRIAKLGAEVEALREAGGGTAAGHHADWSCSSHRMGTRPTTIPAKDRIAVI